MNFFRQLFFMLNLFSVFFKLRSMIRITENLQLQPVLASDFELLYDLMSEVYPPAYAHFWEDNGNWYVNSQYSKEKIKEELENNNAEYYFIIFNNEIVGNFRFIWEEKLVNLEYQLL